MGNIANKIDATDKKLSEILSGERYRVDSFQREYRWQRKHIEALISDLSISFLNSYEQGDTVEDSVEYDCYYMGPVVLCKDKNELSIVDGQQRLTSFSLLIIYLYHQQKKIETDIELRDLKNHLYVQKAGKKTLILNVEPRNPVMEHLLNNPKEAFSELEEIDNNKLEKDSDESVINLLSRYEDITMLFPEELRESKILPLFVEWLLERVILVEVKAYSMENAYTIFETMNDRGMTLSPTEILKGYLLSNIKDDFKSEEANEFWKNRIARINRDTKLDADLEFFRAWLRAKYAVTTRGSKVNAENEDFELIATQFNSWVKNNAKKVFLKDSNDYYFFIVSDFDFFSELFIKLYEYKNNWNEEYNELYINNFYPIADSLSYPLLLSPITKIDDEKIIKEKILLVNEFIDTYTNLRLISSKSITQSSIRNSIYEIIKEFRNNEINELKTNIRFRLKEMFSNEDGYTTLHQMNNWGYYHYFFARIKYYMDNEEADFQELLRNKKQSSYVLHHIFEANDFEIDLDNSHYNHFLSAVGNYFLLRRYHLEEYGSKRSVKTKLKFLIKYNYLPEIPNLTEDTIPDIVVVNRDNVFNDMTKTIWSTNF